MTANSPPSTPEGVRVSAGRASAKEDQMPAFRILAAFLVAAMIGLAVGCGGDDDDEAAPETEEAAGQTVGMSEYGFEPSDVTARQGETITAENTGSIVHNFTIEKGPDAEKATQELAATPDVQPGDSAELTLDLKPGDYALVCTIAGHRDLGMVGSFTVK
jgi:uncharacterized cupredoxin-like copper-binding protein